MRECLWGDTEVTCNVIVIEDEPLIALDIEFAAQDAGCNVLGVARTIEEALQMFESMGFDGAILDANLNGKSAKPLTDHLEGKNMPYVIVSGYTRDQLDYLNDDVVLVGKPFSTTDLTETIRQEILLKSDDLLATSNKKS